MPASARIETCSGTVDVERSFMARRFCHVTAGFARLCSKVTLLLHAHGLGLEAGSGSRFRNSTCVTHAAEGAFFMLSTLFFINIVGSPTAKFLIFQQHRWTCQNVCFKLFVFKHIVGLSCIFVVMPRRRAYGKLIVFNGLRKGRVTRISGAKSLSGLFIIHIVGARAVIQTRIAPKTADSAQGQTSLTWH